LTKGELSQLYHLNREIERDQHRINELRRTLEDVKNETATDSVKGSMVNFPYTQRSIKIEGLTDIDENKIYKLRSEIADTVKLIELKQEQSILEYNRLSRYICEIPDSEMRQIMSLRYINGLSWHQVARHIGEYDESFPRQKHNRWLTKNNKVVGII